MNPSVDGLCERERRLGEVIVACLQAREAGQQLDRQRLLADHPELAEDLAAFFEGQDRLEGLAAPFQGPISPEPMRLGDFRILREVGRGGMGVVYEAEQVSLRGRVVLKVLPFAATLDPRHLQRFHNEAQAAACLHHTHIVPVYSVGCERGTHFYAMQLIDGRPLSELIHQLRRREKKPTQPAPKEGPEQQTTVYQPSVAEGITPHPTIGLAGDSTPWSLAGRRDREYYRRVAELGVQAAEALDHAHQLGIVHRDVKPGNLLVDGRGNLWVTDFGLAQVQSDARLTRTGDLVGTLRYMSPEQALARRVVIDHRTDIYSLGATVYELLTLRPAFGGEDRQELLRQIAFEEPAAPRGLYRAIPAELETIVLKAMEKNPAERYGTAKEVADDLRHWLEDRPIRARRPTLVQRARKWARRHQTAVRATSVLLSVLLALGFGFALWWARLQATAEAEARSALQEAARWRQEEKWPEAVSAAQRAQAVLRSFGGAAGLRQEVAQQLKDLEMAQLLEEAQLQETALNKESFDAEACVAAYRAAFQWYDLDVEHLDPTEAGELVRSRSIRAQLVAALDNWASRLRDHESPQRKQLLAVARTADPDPCRDRLRDALQMGEAKVLEELVASGLPDDLPPETVVLIARQLLLGNALGKPMDKRMTRLLLRVQRRSPNNFWVNTHLGKAHLSMRPPSIDTAIRFNSVAVALRPQSPGAHVNLGTALREKGQLDDAIAELQEAIRLKGDYATAHHNLGVALKDKGQVEEAIAEFREATRHNDRSHHFHTSLARTLYERGRVDEAAAEFRAAIALNEDDAEAHNGLGAYLCDHKRDYDGAIAEFRAALRIKPDDIQAHTNLGNALTKKGRLDDAVAEYRKAIHLEPRSAPVHWSLANVLLVLDRSDEAIDALRQVVRLQKDDAEAHRALGVALGKKGRLDEAIDVFRQLVRLQNNDGEAHRMLGLALGKKGRLDECMKEFRAAIRINKKDALAHNNLGAALAERGELDEAIAEFRKATTIQKDYAHAHKNLADALLKKGELEEAIVECRAALRLKEDFAEAYCILGLVLLRQEKFRQAAKEIRRGHEIGSRQPGWRYPSAEHLHTAEKLADLDARLPALLNRREEPRDAGERLALAEFCQVHKKLFAASARWYSEAFLEKPQLADDLRSWVRYNAACAAALAGCGQGKDADRLDAKERSRLRQQARDWLRADLKAYGQRLEKSAGKAGPAVAKRLQDWLEDKHLAAVRGAEALARLPEAEQKEWHKLWQEVEALRQRAAQPPKTVSATRT